MEEWERNKPDRGFCSGPARFAKHCSGVKRDERDHDVNVEPEGREGGGGGGGGESVLQHHSAASVQ